MEENVQHFLAHYALFFQKQAKMQLKCKKKSICSVYREGAVTDRTCQKWFVNFHAGDFSLDDAPWSGRPIEVDSDQIKTLTESNQC